MPPAGFEPAIPAGEWPQNHALDRAATGIGSSKFKVNYFKTKNKIQFILWFNETCSFAEAVG
jgi:hypothetical protein